MWNHIEIYKYVYLNYKYVKMNKRIYNAYMTIS